MDPVELAAHAIAVSTVLGLSPTQALVAIGVWLGLTEKQTGRWLGRSEWTIHAHLRAIRQRDNSGGRRRQIGLALAVERAITKCRSNLD